MPFNPLHLLKAMLLKSLEDSLKQVEMILCALSELPEHKAQEAYIGQRIGSHIRHVTDHFTALLKLSDSDTIDYNSRSRNSPTETDIAYAREHVADIMQSLENAVFGDRTVVCVSEVDVTETKSAEFKSTADREALWVFNHTIHHIALIKILAEQSGIRFDHRLGLAPATASFERSSN